MPQSVWPRTVHRIWRDSRETIRGIPEFVDCLRVNGRIDYIGLVVSASVSDLNNLSDNLLNRGLGITRIDGFMVLDTPKWFGGYPVNRLPWKT
jgi:Lrp/AsnC family transcriptional regulator, leucine-responsive regulatory protein